MTMTRTIGTVLCSMLVAAGCVAELDTGADPGRGHWSAESGTFAMDISKWARSVTDAEIACLREEGVRHMVIGTQDRRLTRQQLEQSMRGGMSLDAYVYLYWGRSMADQVANALETIEGYPVHRLWLDIEERPPGIGRAALIARIQEAVDACGSTPCGIYTADWWWIEHVGNTNAFADVPLWYADWDNDPSLSTWPDQQFGGWEQPLAKQYWGDIRVCEVLGDVNTFREVPEPAYDPPAARPAPAGVPEAPTGLYPDGVDVPSAIEGALRILAGSVPGAERYQFEIEHWNGTAWRPYYTYTKSVSALIYSPSPSFGSRSYRFRARGGNAHGYGAWSDWATFFWGRGGLRAPEAPAEEPPPPAEEPPPPAEEPPPPPVEEPPPPPVEEPPVDGAPTGLSPDGGTLSAPAVTLGWGAVSGADAYEVEIEYDAGRGYVAYYTYRPTGTSRLFYPAVRGVTFRFRVRARVAGAYGAWSSHATFDYL